jgi:AraC-like DNA-binding protein
MVYAAKKSNNAKIIGSAYLSKGIVYYSLKKQRAALDNYIIADSYISRTNDKYLINKLKYNIALVKYYLGYYDEAISLFKECISYFQNENPRAYLNSLHSLGLCYNRIGNYGLCSQTNLMGLKLARELDIKEMEVYFIHSEGINEYYKQNFASAIKNLESSIKELKENKDFGNESVGYFYLGKSYWQIKKYDKAVTYFKRVDQLYSTKDYIRPDLREAYEILIKYYRTKDNAEQQFYYINQLLKADNELNQTFKYLVGKLNKEYSTQELLIEKEKLKKELVNKNQHYSTLTIASLLLLVGFLFFTFRYFKNRKNYKKKFDELLQKFNNSNKPKNREKNEKPLISEINAETVASILRQLEKFEKDKKFLEKDWSLDMLSTSFNSNTKYLSKIIRHYRGKNFNDYINDLRIDYIIALLYSDKKIRNFTNKALAEEAGFSSTQRFANAFRAKTEMPTAYFIEQIRKDKNI